MMPFPLRMFLAMGLLALGILLVVDYAYPHSAPSGWKYPPDCCDPEGWECDPIPAEAVKQLPNGMWEITLTAKDHKFVPRTATKDNPMVYNYPSAIRASGDGEYHACISKNGQTIHCLFIPLSM